MAVLKRQKKTMRPISIKRGDVGFLSTYSAHENVFLGNFHRALEVLGVVPLLDGAQFLQREQAGIDHRVLGYGVKQTEQKIGKNMKSRVFLYQQYRL